MLKRGLNQGGVSWFGCKEERVRESKRKKRYEGLRKRLPTEPKLQSEPIQAERKEHRSKAAICPNDIKYHWWLGSFSNNVIMTSLKFKLSIELQSRLACYRRRWETDRSIRRKKREMKKEKKEERGADRGRRKRGSTLLSFSLTRGWRRTDGQADKDFIWVTREKPLFDQYWLS